TVQRAIARGRRHVEIARELNLSVWTIAKIADDRRFDPPPVGDEKQLADNGPCDYVALNLRRCPGCGAMIYISPCLACQMATQTLRLPPAPEIEDEPEEAPPALTGKQKRWRRRRIRELVFGQTARS